MKWVFAVLTVLISVRVNDSAPSLGTHRRGGWVRGTGSKDGACKIKNDSGTARSLHTAFLLFASTLNSFPLILLSSLSPLPFFYFANHFLPPPPTLHKHLNLVWCLGGGWVDLQRRVGWLTRKLPPPGGTWGHRCAQARAWTQTKITFHSSKLADFKMAKAVWINWRIWAWPHPLTARGCGRTCEYWQRLLTRAFKINLAFCPQIFMCVTASQCNISAHVSPFLKVPGEQKRAGSSPAQHQKHGALIDCVYVSVTLVHKY